MAFRPLSTLQRWWYTPRIRSNLLTAVLAVLMLGLGVAVAAALLLDMVMLSGGIERSFGELLRSRGYQLRISPLGTLPCRPPCEQGAERDSRIRSGRWRRRGRPSRSTSCRRGRR